MYALERGIEAAFQLEDSELDQRAAARPADGRGRMLFTEAAEGGAGVLRRLQTSRTRSPGSPAEALEISHYDPKTGDDLRPRPRRRERCERGCYDCLLVLRQPVRPRAHRPPRRRRPAAAARSRRRRESQAGRR